MSDVDWWQEKCREQEAEIEHLQEDRQLLMQAGYAGKLMKEIERLREEVAALITATNMACDSRDRLRDAIESAGRCLVMSNNGAEEALAILREAKEGTAFQPDVAIECICPACGIRHGGKFVPGEF